MSKTTSIFASRIYDLYNVCMALGPFPLPPMKERHRARFLRLAERENSM